MNGSLDGVALTIHQKSTKMSSNMDLYSPRPEKSCLPTRNVMPGHPGGVWLVYEGTLCHI